MGFEYYWDLIFSIFFIVIGGISVFLAYQGLNKTFKMKKNGIATTGKIVKIEEEYNDGKVFYPFLEFKTLTGLIVKSKMDGRSNNSLELGQEVEVYYNSEMPDDFIVNTNFESKYKYFLVLVPGIGMLGVGIYKYFNFIND